MVILEIIFNKPRLEWCAKFLQIIYFLNTKKYLIFLSFKSLAWHIYGTEVFLFIIFKKFLTSKRKKTVLINLALLGRKQLILKKQPFSCEIDR